MTFREFQYWQWFNDIHPVGIYGDDGRAADMMRYQANMNADKQHQQKLRHFIDKRAEVEQVANSGNIASEWDAFLAEHTTNE